MRVAVRMVYKHLLLMSLSTVFHVQTVTTSQGLDVGSFLCLAGNDLIVFLGMLYAWLKLDWGLKIQF